MRDIDKLCMNCFSELTQGSVCQDCGYDNEKENDFGYLPVKTYLQGRYVVGTVQKHDSDAVSYMGYDNQIDKIIIIREYYPKTLANRLEGANEVHVRERFKKSYDEYKNSFFKLWTTLEKMHNLSAVMSVYDVFEENNTCYAVMEYMQTIPLREFLLHNPDGYITWDKARLMFMPVLTTIETLHSNGIVHGSITPDNLVLCRDGKVRLSEFPIVQSGDVTTDLEFQPNDGYTALEQYDNNHKICPATDIYGFSACIYRALVGTNPPDSLSRASNDKLMIPNSIAEQIPIHVIKAMGNGLQVYPEKRIQSIAQFRELLDAAPAVQAQSSQNFPKVETPKPSTDYTKYVEQDIKDEKKSKIVATVIAVLVVIAVVAGVVVANHYGVFSHKQEETTVATTVGNYDVPNFANNGFTQSDVQNNGAWNEQFDITFEAEYSKDATEGEIFKQSVKAGENVKGGTEIILTVSKGIQTQILPDVGSLTVEEATKKLEDLGFKVSTVEVYNDGVHAKGTVKPNYGMAPAAGETVAVGDEVVLQVYGEVVTTTQPETTAPVVE